MCRLLAYAGPAVPLSALLTAPDHALLVQSYAPKEMTSGTLNADGYGFAWYDAGLRPEPFCYRTILPMWNDANLDQLAGYVRSGHVLANVRSATPGQALDFSNTQPFVAGRLAAMHNGFVADFRTTLYRLIRNGIGEDAYAALAGNTDSEHLFAWILHHVEADGDLAGGVARAFDELAALAPDVRMSLNFVFSDGDTIVATRHARHAPCPTLYLGRDLAAYSDAVLIASEPLSADAGWTAIDPHVMVVVGSGGVVEHRPMGAP